MAKSQKKHHHHSKKGHGHVSKEAIREKAKRALLKRRTGEVHERRTQRKGRAQLSIADSRVDRDIDDILRTQRHRRVPGMEAYDAVNALGGPEYAPAGRHAYGPGAAEKLDSRSSKARVGRLFHELGRGFKIRRAGSKGCPTGWKKSKKNRYVCTYGGVMIHAQPEPKEVLKYALSQLNVHKR